jgi:protein disulfide-isomerase
MKKTLPLLLAAITMVVVFGFKNYKSKPMEGELDWHTSLMEAHDLSKAEKKPIFALFTGSDWCIWCKKLDRDVLAKAEFIDWAKKNVILLYLDFPRTKQLSADIAAQNNNLQQTFRVSGYPTVWIFNTEKNDATNNINITALGSLGYPQGAEVGNEQIKFLADANRILANVAAAPAAK